MSENKYEEGQGLSKIQARIDKHALYKTVNKLRLWLAQNEKIFSEEFSHLPDNNLEKVLFDSYLTIARKQLNDVKIPQG